MPSLSITIKYSISNSSITLSPAVANGSPIQYKNSLIVPKEVWANTWPLFICVQPGAQDTLDSVTSESLDAPMLGPPVWNFKYRFKVEADGLRVKVVAKRGSIEQSVNIVLLPRSSAQIASMLATRALTGLDDLLLKPPPPKQTRDPGPLHGPKDIRGPLPPRQKRGKRPGWQDSDGNTTDTGGIVGPMDPPANVLPK